MATKGDSAVTSRCSPARVPVTALSPFVAIVGSLRGGQRQRYAPDPFALPLAPPAPGAAHLRIAAAAYGPTTLGTPPTTGRRAARLQQLAHAAAGGHCPIRRRRVAHRARAPHAPPRQPEREATHGSGSAP